MKIILAIILGSLFGFALYKSGASNTKKILSMLRLENLNLAKIILFAIGFSSILVFIANSLGIFDISHFSVKATNLGVIIGGIIFGIGFGSIGSCPGTCVAAAGGASFKKAFSAILGGLFGAFIFSLSYGWFSELGLFSTIDLGKLTLFQISDKYPSVFQLGFIGLLISGIILSAVAWFLPSKPFKKDTISSLSEE
ncbi:YeeE/YedE thiosulfate transporter family protein [Proteiniborus sp.]|uniref:YeeE/YedE thiosulfate transporter family protein n=1 Tax=Proteiniborus sp. TaxID=2079015 RepID=UPI003322C56A